MKKKRGENFSVLKRVMFFLDVFLAVLIILAAKYVVGGTGLGRISLLFGLIMLSVSIFLMLIQR